MNHIFRKNELFPVNSKLEDWSGRTLSFMPLGLCRSWRTNGSELIFDVVDDADPEWMRHVFNALSGLGVSFLAGIHPSPDRFEVDGPPVEQFCVAMTLEDAEKFMPRIQLGYELALGIAAGL